MGARRNKSLLPPQKTGKSAAMTVECPSEVPFVSKPDYKCRGSSRKIKKINYATLRHQPVGSVRTNMSDGHGGFQTLILYIKYILWWSVCSLQFPISLSPIFQMRNLQHFSKFKFVTLLSIL